MKKLRRVVQAGALAGLLTAAALAFASPASAQPANCTAMDRQYNSLLDSAIYEYRQAGYWISQGDNALATSYMAEGDRDYAAAMRIQNRMEKIHCA